MHRSAHRPCLDASEDRGLPLPAGCCGTRTERAVWCYDFQKDITFCLTRQAFYCRNGCGTNVGVYRSTNGERDMIIRDFLFMQVEETLTSGDNLIC